MELLTDRLLLRPLQAGDLVHLQRYAVREAFFRFLPIDKQTSQDVEKFLSDRLAEQDKGVADRLTFAIEPLDEGHIIGTVRIEIQDKVYRQGDLGFAMDLEHQGKGYMTEAVRSVLSTGFEHLELHRIWATADTENERSWRLMERVGMTREGLLRQDTLNCGQWRDSYLYAILASDGIEEN